MYECQFKKMKRNDSEMTAYVENHPLLKTEPLCIRQSFYGGRVNCTKMYHKADVENGEIICYQDFTSLYPTVNKVSKIKQLKS